MGFNFCRTRVLFLNLGKRLSGSQNLWQAGHKQGENLMILDTPADGGSRMQEVRNNVVDIKAKLTSDDTVIDVYAGCEAFAALFLNGSRPVISRTHNSVQFWVARVTRLVNLDRVNARLYLSGRQIL